MKRYVVHGNMYTTGQRTVLKLTITFGSSTPVSQNGMQRTGGLIFDLVRSPDVVLQVLLGLLPTRSSREDMSV